MLVRRLPAFKPIQLVLIAASAAIAVVPISPEAVERIYARRIYPALQAAMTAWSNVTGLALFDLLIVAAASILLVQWVRWIGRARRGRTWRPVASGLFATIVIAAAVNLWFALFWGLNYARPSIADRLGFDAARVSPAAVRALGDRAVREVNARYETAHARGFPGVYDVPADLTRALHAIETSLGRPRATVPGRPKRTILAPFFRASGTDGMTDPFFLETLLNPDLTAPERPMVLAHEWAHLSGFAPEAEASFVAVLTALGADTPSQYSAWLSLVLDIATRLSPAERQRMTERLEPGPRRDWELIAARGRARVPTVERVSWGAYDRYLRSQGVEDGVVSYSRVIELLVGTNALARFP